LTVAAFLLGGPAGDKSENNKVRLPPGLKHQKRDRGPKGARVNWEETNKKGVNKPVNIKLGEEKRFGAGNAFFNVGLQQGQ